MTGALPDTIAAVATPSGRGGVGVVRISGPGTSQVTRRILGILPPPRQALYRVFRDADGTPIDRGIALFFPAPHSYTGDDVLELQGHGGPVVMDMLLQAAVRLGARQARPGEFSERAFLNGKLDLAQAEAVADLIESSTEQAARGAYHSLQGEFSARVCTLVDSLTELRTYVEAAIDFAEEEENFLSGPELEERLRAVVCQAKSLLANAHQGALLRDGMTLVIAGRPNVGKSSLLNALAGRDSAIVTEIPGTTRDVLREHIQIDGMPVHVLDTAGLRQTDDAVERVGIDRAWQAISQADALLLVVDHPLGFGPSDQELLERFPPGPDRIVVHNKVDLIQATARIDLAVGGQSIHLSALTGEGLPLLREHLKGLMGFAGGEGCFTARRRHLEALRRAGVGLGEALTHLRDGHAGELVAEDLRQAQHHLGEITGEFTPDDLLGRIFASFCIGK
jgi:tRNA modification GTPase